MVVIFFLFFFFVFVFIFFFNDTATTEIYTLSLHDALPILINVTYYKGLESINDRIKLYEDNHRLNNGYNSFLGVYYLSTKNNKIVVDAAIKPKRVWVASLYRLFEMIE